MKTDVLIVGGGPAGLTAAYEAVSRGLKVVLAEESWSLGGQLRQQTQIIEDLPPQYGPLRGYMLSKNLVERLKPYSDSINIMLNHTAIGVYADGSIGLSNNNSVIPVEANSYILATGASEIPVVFSGWTLPGVMTIGAAQILINRERVYPGQRTIIVGSSDFALEVALQIKAVGIEVLALVEEKDRITACDKKLILEFEACGIPIFLKTNVTSVVGSGKVEKVFLDSEQEYNVDFVCVDGGRQPIIEPFSMCNCQLDYQADLGGWLPKYNRDLETSTTGVFVAGNAAGVTCQGALLLTGIVAGISVTERSNIISITEGKKLKQPLWEEIQKIESLQFPKIWKARLSHLA